MIYDKDLLLESVSAIDVAEALGLPMKYIGNRCYIPCPTHLTELGKEDTNLGNCILHDKGCYCFACSKGVNTINLIRYTTNCSFPKALEFMANLSGDEELFSAENGFNEKINMPLTNSELEFIGLAPKNPQKGFLVNAGEYNETIPNLYSVKSNTLREKPEWIYDEENDEVEEIINLKTEFLFYRKEPGLSMLSLFSENKEAFYSLTMSKALDCYENFVMNKALYSENPFLLRMLQTKADIKNLCKQWDKLIEETNEIIKKLFDGCISHCSQDEDLITRLKSWAK